MAEPTIEQATQVASEVFAGHDEWEAALGRYVRLFSDIEYSSFWFVNLFGTVDDFAEAQGLLFKRRKIFAKKLALTVLPPRSPELNARWQAFFEDAIQHGENVRNKVLHNPLMVSVYQSASTGELAAKMEMALMRKEGHYITFEQLQQHLGELDTLNDRWRSLWAETTKLAFREPKGGHQD